MRLRNAIFAAVAAAGIISCTPRSEEAANPVNIILDTDMGNDIDDAIALDMLYTCIDSGYVNLMAIMVNKDDAPYPASFIDIMGTYYGHKIPVGAVYGGTAGPGDAVNFARILSEMVYPGGDPLFERSDNCLRDLPSATELYRRTLSQAADSSVVIASIGFYTNLARLLESPADEYSPLTGSELVARKVRLLSAMGGTFTGGFAEFNIKNDIAAAQKVFCDWPTDIVLSPFEVGNSILYPAASLPGGIEGPHPLREGYKVYCGDADRPCWDPSAVLYAVEGSRWFTLGEAGTVAIDSTGITTFAPDSAGRIRILQATPAQSRAAAQRIVSLVK